MSTHYDLHMPTVDPCSQCGRGDEADVIPFAQTAVGWRIKVHVHPDRGLQTLADWRPLLAQGRIIDEYGQKVDAAVFFEMIAARKDLKSHIDEYPEPGSYKDGPVDMLAGAWS